MCPMCTRRTDGLEGGSYKPYVSKVYEVYGWLEGRKFESKVYEVHGCLEGSSKPYREGGSSKAYVRAGLERGSSKL